MTRKQFKVEYKLIREAGIRGLLAAGKTRLSEAAMTMANVDKPKPSGARTARF